MDQTNAETMSNVCPGCGGSMELSADGEKAVCPFCGRTVYLEKEDVNEGPQKNNQPKSRLRAWLIGFCIFAGLVLINILIPGSQLRELIFPRTVNPFMGVSVEFHGMSGEGRAELKFSSRKTAEFADPSRYKVTPETGLHNGDVVTVKASAPAGWRFEPSEKEFTVEGLTVWVMSTDQISGDNLAAIHANTEQRIQEDWGDIVPTSFASDITYTPYRMYLFVSEEKNGYDYNVLYDTYEVKVTRADGSVFTSYEACRYADLKIPADGVMTAHYGTLQGFNFGFQYGFSYAQAFSGWTGVEQMEGDLRHVNDGRYLAD